MKIAISNTARHHGGQETIAATLAEQLSARGHEVLFLCRPVSPLRERLRDTVTIAPVLSGFDGDVFALWRARRVLKEHRPAVLLATTNKDMRSAAVAARAAGVPVVIRRGMGRALPNTARYRFLYGRLPAHIVVNSEDTRRITVESAPWLDPARVSVIRNGIDLRRFENIEPADLGLPPDAVAIGYVGQFVPRKGLHTLADAWPRIVRAVPEAHLLLAGNGVLEAEIRTRLDSVPNTRLLGFRRDVPALMRALDLLVHPAIEEGIPNVVMEAMASGTAVVATSSGGTAELVTDGEAGRLVPPENAEVLAEAVVELARDPERRARMGRLGRARVERDCSLARMVDAYETLLSEVAARGGEG